MIDPDVSKPSSEQEPKILNTSSKEEQQPKAATESIKQVKINVSIV